MNRLLILFMASTVSLLGQTTALVTPGSVSGRVVDADTNMPLVGVRIVAAVDRRVERSTTTDSQGRYILPNLPPGKRSIDLEPDMGPSVTAPQSVTVIGGNDSHVDFHIRLFAQVSGRVLDEDGNPLAGIQVSAIRKEYERVTLGGVRSSLTGELELVSVLAKELTDDQGRYLITTIPAGNQYRIAASRPRRYAVPVSDAPAEPETRKRTLAATYYPNANSIDTAPPILLHSQEVRDGVDIHMLKAESYCLEATLTEGGVPSPMQFKLVETSVESARLPAVNLPGGSGSGSDGKIRLCDLYPGQFQLIAARLSTSAQESIAAVDITIADRDVRGLVVAAIPRSRVSGEVVWDKQPVVALTQSIRLMTYPTPALSPPLTLSVPSMFELNVVPGSSYVIAISGMDSHAYLKDITYGGASILRQPFVPYGSHAIVRITIGSDAGSITATVSDTNGRPAAGSAVLIVPVAARTEPEVAAMFHAGITDENGTYVEKGLPPGQYDVFAAIDPGPNRIDRGQIMLIDRTPEAIGRIVRARARGIQVEVNPSSDASISVAPIRLD